MKIIFPKAFSVISVNIVLLIASMFITISPLTIQAQVESQGKKEDIWSNCPIAVTIKGMPTTIPSKTTAIKFVGEVVRTPNKNSTIGCYWYYDEVHVSISRYGLATDFRDEKFIFNRFSTVVTEKSFGVNMNFSGSANDGSEIPFDIRFTVTRSPTLNEIQQYTYAATPGRVTFCVAKCGGTNPIPTGVLPTPSSPPNINIPGYNGNTGYGNVPDYDRGVSNFNNLIKPKSVPELIGQIVRIMLALIAAIAVIVIIIAGFRMVLYGSNPSELSKAKSAIAWAIIGLVVALMSFSIVAVLQRVISQGNP